METGEELEVILGVLAGCSEVCPTAAATSKLRAGPRTRDSSQDEEDDCRL